MPSRVSPHTLLPLSLDPTAEPASPCAVPPDLRPYDIILVNSSGGKDSQAMLHVLVGWAQEQHVRQRRLWPSSTARYCTSDHK